MSKIDYSKRPKSFSRVLSYEGLEEYELCSVSGKLAMDFCLTEDTVYSVLLDEKSYKALDECQLDDHFEELPEEEIIPPEGEILLPDNPLSPDDPIIPEENTGSEDAEAPLVTEI